MTTMAEEQHTDEAEASTGAFPKVDPKNGGMPKKGRNVGLKFLTTALIVVLCALVGLGYVTQRQNLQTSYSSLSEDELVRLLDESNTQIGDLQTQKQTLQTQLDSIQSSVDKQEEKKKVAQENETTNGILSGRLPAHGPGIVLTITEGAKQIDAATMFNVIEELRNAGAEVIQVGSVRVITSTSFTDEGNGVSCDGVLLANPYVIMAIGDSNALENAIEIAGGVKSHLSVQFNAEVSIVKENDVSITKVRKIPADTYASTVN
jgi:uncharacterized protein YlxW (UPF0749 family)